MSRIIFGLVASLILIGTSYFTAYTYSICFRWNSRVSMTAFLLFLLASLFFAISIFLVRGGIGPIGSAFYAIVQVAAGFGFYLFIGAIALALYLAASTTIGAAPSQAVAYGVLCAALLLGIAGLIQARFIKVTTYEVALAGAPQIWEGRTAALVADTHFGIINKRAFSDQVVDKIISLKPDFVLHAGDFYDGPAMDTFSITESWKKIAQRLLVFYAPGNHETYGDYKEFISSLRDAGIVVLEDKKVAYDGVDIAGFVYREKGAAATVGSVASAMRLSEAPAIAIIHTPIFHSELSDAGVDLVVSGHTHRGQFWPLNIPIRMIYGSYAYGMNAMGEGVSITTSGVGTFGPPFRLFNTPEIVLIRFRVK